MALLGNLFPESIFARKLPEAAERRLRLAQARAEESIVRVHVDNALMFMDTLAEDMTFDRAIETYIRVMGIPEPLASTVATRALVVLGQDLVPFRRRQRAEANGSGAAGNAGASPGTNGEAAPAEMSAGDLQRVRDGFVQAARRAHRIGLQAIELHAAHGYLLHQFLSPLSNRRTDGYGGSREARMRFPLEVVEAVRAEWPEDRPLFVRVSAVDGTPDGLLDRDAYVALTGGDA